MSNSYWWYITVTDGGTLGGAAEELLSSAADISGCLGTELQELPDGVRMRICYRSDRELAEWRERLFKALEPWPGVRVEDAGKIENQPWHTNCEEGFPPLAVGRRFVVLAPWHRGTEPRDRVSLIVNPGGAFGTGYHESTQAALELFERHLDRGGRAESVIDVGTGSGILSIAALKTGSSRVRSRDIDPAVIDEVLGNMALNDIDMSAALVETGDLLSGVEDRYDLLFANILLDPLRDMLPGVGRVLLPGGTAIFSGMTESESEDFLESLAAAGMSVLDELVRGEWWAVSAAPSA